MNVPAHSRIEIYDTTLRDGTQGRDVSLSLADKLRITKKLDELGVDWIEGGYPLSNPKDVAYFEQVRQLPLKHAKICAFGMTRRRDISPKEDTGMQALVASESPVITIVGKTWDLHVDEVLRISRDENLAMIRESLDFCRSSGREVFYDAEHFFDGFRANPDYSLKTLQAALNGGATRLILCDTNGGSLPRDIRQAIEAVRQALGKDVLLGIHTHNDGGLAVANSLEAIDCGAVQVQGTINGMGERCGNADLTTVAANLHLKLGRSCLQGAESVCGLTALSRFVYELTNLTPQVNQPYVGPGAFAHKGGMHVHAVNRLARSYEHIEPESVGNHRVVLVSELSGVSTIAGELGKKYGITEDKQVQRRILERVQNLEHAGYMFEAAGASLELLVRKELGLRRTYWELDHYRCVILRVDGQAPGTEATVKLHVGDQTEHHVAEGDGPVNAVDGALRKCLLPHYPTLAQVHLRDFKVRVVNAREETAAKVRVVIDFAVVDAEGRTRDFSTTGVDENIVNASWEALIDAFEHHLLEGDVPAPA